VKDVTLNSRAECPETSLSLASPYAPLNLFIIEIPHLAADGRALFVCTAL
jgi:hypothetical protein